MGEPLDLVSKIKISRATFLTGQRMGYKASREHGSYRYSHRAGTMKMRSIHNDVISDSEKFRQITNIKPKG